jgi:hypothetical protein
MIFLLLPFLTSLSSLSWAHIMGKSQWCLSNSPVHFECFYESQESCEKMKKMRGKFKVSSPTGDLVGDWNCEVFPYEYSLKPESKLPEGKN